MKRNPESIGNTSGIRRVFRTATPLPSPARIHNRKQSRRRHSADRFALAGPHEQSDDFITLLMQQHGRGGTVNSATHRQHDSITHLQKHPITVPEEFDSVCATNAS